MCELLRTPLAVVGAGPAGIMAAYTAAEAGVDVTLIDDNPLPGGQYYRQSPPDFEFSNPSDAYSGRLDAPAILRKPAHPKIRPLYKTLVWGAFTCNEHHLALSEQEKSYILLADRLVLATGAYDRPFAFPGWTLPGILGAGAAMRMIKTQWVLPGKRILLAGLGPLQLALAEAIIHSGAEVVCVADATNPYQSLKELPVLLEHLDRIQEALGYLNTLRKHRVPLLFNHAIISASGKDCVQQVQIARLDSQGTPVLGTEKQFDVDAVCLGYGLIPSFQLAAVLGCKLRFDPLLGWWVPEHNDYMETSQPGVFVAGDVTGIAGAKVALLEGQIAGLVAAYQLKYLNDKAFREQFMPLFSRLKRLNRLARALQKIYAFRPGLSKIATEDTQLCRCEEVTLMQVKEAIANGAADLHQVKLATRVGMGYCQGRFCSSIVAPVIAEATGKPLPELPPFTIRPPIQPTSVQNLAFMYNKFVTSEQRF